MGRDSTVITVISSPPSRGESKEACLVVINGLDLGKRYTIAQTSVLIGRSSKTDIRIDEDSISRHHALLINDGNRVILRDLDSTNGTYVNDVQIKERTLNDSDQIRVGRTIFKFLTGNNIENAYHEEIYKLTTTDCLTQVHNKRYFIEHLEREMSRSLRYKRSLALLMFDIDRFKWVNDTYGHLTGDFILKQLAGRIKEQIRRDDIFARYGGEEFALLLPELGARAATQLAQKIRKLVAADPFTFDQAVIPVTISIGVGDLNEYLERIARGPDPSTEPVPEGLVKLVDERLYKAKHNGRNCVINYD
ncbi:MAG: GGDEF domain-containing protein [Myxococcales bacterium]|nr:GGDEF domain-containing protein [Myxococcales bacterium]